MNLRQLRGLEGLICDRANKETAVLFDLGGTLIRIDLFAACQALAKHCDWHAQSIMSRLWESPQQKEFSRGTISSDDFYEYWRQQFRWRADQDKFWECYSAIYPSSPDAIINVVEDVREYVEGVYLFSDTNPAHMQRLAKDYPQTLAPFKRCFLSYQLGLTKREITAFERIAEALPAAKTFVIIDNNQDVLNVASRLGWFGILIKPDSK